MWWTLVNEHTPCISDVRCPIFRLDCAAWRRQQFVWLRCLKVSLNEAYSALFFVFCFVVVVVVVERTR